MRHYLLPSIMLLLLSGCDINESMRSQAQDGATAEARAVVAKAGCMGCHAVSNSVYGPAWKLVSEKYQGTPNAHETLAAHINDGSYGRWDHITGGKRMPPQKGALDETEMTIVIDYILSLSAPSSP